jgi:hypothetical protein
LISTNFDTVALIVTVPVVDCPKQQTAETTSSVVSSNDLMIRRGIVGFLGGGVRYGYPAVNRETNGRHH